MENSCKKCGRVLAEVWSPTLGPSPEGAPEGTGYHSRSGGALCAACLLAARAARAADAPQLDAVREAHRAHQAASKEAHQPAPRTRRRRAPRRSVERSDAVADRVARGEHPWAHDEE